MSGHVPDRIIDVSWHSLNLKLLDLNHINGHENSSGTKHWKLEELDVIQYHI